MERKTAEQNKNVSEELKKGLSAHSAQLGLGKLKLKTL